ncbi:hypothetical protein BH23GEM9_BH23GEM9_16910 [soil metagenome]
MPHVDEGILHAYLDGGLQSLSDAGAIPGGATVADIETHLRSCVDCRSLLEAERAVRERAGIVLRDAAGVAADVPPFEMLTRTPATTTSVRHRSWVPMAWAASVMLAVGAGWWGSEVWRAGQWSDFDAAEMTAPGAATRAASAAPDEQARPAASEPDQQTASSAATASSPAGDAATQRVGGFAAGDDITRLRSADRTPVVADADPAAAAVVAPAVAEARAEAIPLGAPMAAAAAAVVEPLVVAASPPAPAAPARAAGFAALPPPVAHMAADARTGDTRSGDTRSGDARDARTAAQGASPAGTTVTPAAAGAAAERAAASTLGGGTPTQALAAFRASVARARAGEFEWLPLSRDDLQRSATSALVVRGGEQPAIDAAAGAVPSRLLRVRQRIGDGPDVELMMWRRPQIQLEEITVTGAAPRLAQERRGAGDAPAALLQTMLISSEPAGEGEHEIFLMVPLLDTYVVIRARAPEAVLREIALRLVQHN